MSRESIFYEREVRKRTTQKEFEEVRNQYPAKLTDQEAHQKFDFYDLGVYIEIRFESSKLSYLAVSNDIAQVPLAVGYLAL